MLLHFKIHSADAQAVLALESENYSDAPLPTLLLPSGHLTFQLPSLLEAKR